MNATMSSSDITTLIDTILTTPDPAVIGLRRILKNKRESAGSFPCQPIGYDEFRKDEGAKLSFSDEERHVLEVEKQVAQLKAELEAEKKRSKDVLNAAYQKGFTEGSAQGHLEGHSASEKVFNERVGRIQDIVRKSVEKMALQHDTVLANAHHMIVNLSLACARKVVAAELTIKPDHIIDIVKKTLSYVAERQRVIVRVSPSLCDIIKTNKEAWLPEGEQISGITIISDPTIEAGGCIIESNSGSADSRLGVVFDELSELVEKFWETIKPNEYDQITSHPHESI